MTNTTPWYKSRTVWVSLATMLIGALAIPEVRQIIPPSWAPYLLALSGVVGLGLRLMTNTAIAGSPGDKAPLTGPGNGPTGGGG